MFDNAFVTDIISKVKDILLSYNGDIYLCNIKCTKILDINKFLYKPYILDTLDFINDKIENKIRLSNVEEKLSILVNKMSARYIEIISDIIKTGKAIKIAECVSHMTNKSTVFYYYESGKDYILILSSNDSKIKTTIRYSRKESAIAYIKNNYKYPLEIEKILNSI